jgi:thioredoxin-dependent peroxiredoxin
MAELKTGDAAPDFSLPDQTGALRSLSDFKGKKMILYFYPRDNTPGCTKEACAFQDILGALRGVGAEVVGISGDSVDSHSKFAKKYDLQFPLLSDETKDTLMAYNVWKKKSNYGKEYMGIARTTYLIDEKGMIARVFPNVKVEGHAAEVAAALREMDSR